MWCVCGQLRGVTLERNYDDYVPRYGGRIVADGVEQEIQRGYPQQIQRLQKRKAFTQQKINNEIKTAKEFARQKNKRGAMKALKKKKRYEKARRRPLAGGAERERPLTPWAWGAGDGAAGQHDPGTGTAAHDARSRLQRATRGWSAAKPAGRIGHGCLPRNDELGCCCSSHLGRARAI